MHHHLNSFGQPFEFWREEGILRLSLAQGAQLNLQHMKEFIRLVAALDRSGRAPVLMEFPAHVVVANDARALLRRVCGAQGHPVALFATDAAARAQAELFKHVERPAFPFAVFDSAASAYRWSQEKRQMVDIRYTAGTDR